MKKRFLILVPLCITMTLVGCGNEEPSQIIENSQEISQSTTPTLDFNIDVNNIAKEESNILDGIVKEELEIEEFIEQEKELTEVESIFGQGSNISKYQNYVGNKELGSFGTNYKVNEVDEFPITLNPEDDYNSIYYTIKGDEGYCYARISLVDEIQEFETIKNNFKEVTSKLNYDSIIEEDDFVLSRVLSNSLEGHYQKFFYVKDEEERYLVNIVVKNNDTMTYVSLFGDNIDFIVSLVDEFGDSFEYSNDLKEGASTFKLSFDELNFDDQYHIIEEDVVIDLDKYEKDFKDFEGKVFEIEYVVEEEFIEIDGKKFYNASIFNMYVFEESTFNNENESDIF